eukprot:UN11938
MNLLFCKLKKLKNMGLIFCKLAKKLNPCFLSFLELAKN